MRANRQISIVAGAGFGASNFPLNRMDRDFGVIAIGDLIVINENNEFLLIICALRWDSAIGDPKLRMRRLTSRLDSGSIEEQPIGAGPTSLLKRIWQICRKKVRAMDPMRVLASQPSGLAYGGWSTTQRSNVHQGKRGSRGSES